MANTFYRHALPGSRTLAIHLILVAAAAIGCSGEDQLTPDKARALLSDALEKEQPYTISYAKLAKALPASSVEDYTHGQYERESVNHVIQALLAAGYVVQKAENKVVPLLTGDYVGSIEQHTLDRSLFRLQRRDPSLAPHWNISLRLENVPTTDTVHGAFEQRHNTSSCRVNGEISGILDSPSTGAFHLRYTKGNCKISGENGTLAAKAPDGASIQADCKGSWLDNSPWGASGEVACRARLLEGGNPKATMQVVRYHYSFGDKLMAFVVNPGVTLIAGTVTVDSVQGLLLGPTETSATGEFNWHVDFNEAAAIIEHKSNIEGQGRLVFGKQPDGKWVLTEHAL